MNLIFLCIIVTNIKIWRTVDAVAKRKFHRALIFNQELEKLDDINSVEGKTNCLPCITACSAKYNKDIDFNKKYSLSKKSVFLKKVYDKSNLSGDVETEVCSKFYEPTMLFDEATLTYETGYELYYEEGKVDLKYEEHFYDDFKLIFEVPENPSAIIPSKVKKIFKSEDGKRKLVFYWISVLSMKFNPSKYQIRASFRSDIINDYRDRTIEKCYDYDLGNVLYQSESAKNVNFFNSKQNRVELFDVLFIPPELKPEPKGKPSQIPKESESPFIQSYGKFERAHLVPLMFLHSGAAKLATCTFMNTIPVWSSILNGQLKLIDEYLYTIFRMWSPKVNIIFGVSNISKVKVTKTWKMLKGIYEENDDEESDELAFPKLIYRIVEYGVPGNMAYKVIVIHNDRTASRKDMICSHTSDDWRAISNNDPKTGLSYACPLLSSINDELGAYEEFPSHFKALQLNFMNAGGSGKNAKFVDERKNIKKEMKKLFPNQELSAEEVTMNLYENDSSSLAEPEPEAKLELSYQPQHESKLKPESKPKRDEHIYQFPLDGRFWVL